MSTGVRSTNKPENRVPFAGGRYLLSHRLGNGSFGDIFEGYDTVRECRVAVKLEKKKVRYPQLEYESKVYRVLHQPPLGYNGMLHVNKIFNKEGEEDTEVPPFVVTGIPQVFYYDSEGDYNIMVMELCGPSIEDLFNYCRRRFSLKTVLMIGEQMLHRIQYIHEKGFVHRDIKPENFTFGCGQKAHFLYVIDFGLSKLYWDCRKNTHIPFVDGKPLTGTARYCSANTHRGYEQSRRDDLESIGFLFVYFLKGNLPWQGIQAKDQQLKTIRIGEKKISTTLEELCKGLPTEFLKYSQYSRELSYQQKPDYDYLRGLLRAVAQRYGYFTKSPPTKGLNANSSTANTHFSASANTAALWSSKDYASSYSVTPSTSTRISGKNNVVSALGAHSQGFAVTNAELEINPATGIYDWQFDWIVKRESEVQNGLRQQELARAMAENTSRGAGSQAAQPSVNPVHPSRSTRRDHSPPSDLSTSSSSADSGSSSSSSPSEAAKTTPKVNPASAGRGGKVSPGYSQGGTSRKQPAVNNNTKSKPMDMAISKPTTKHACTPEAQATLSGGHKKLSDPHMNVLAETK